MAWILRVDLKGSPAYTECADEHLALLLDQKMKFPSLSGLYRILSLHDHVLYWRLRGASPIKILQCSWK